MLIQSGRVESERRPAAEEVGTLVTAAKAAEEVDGLIVMHGAGHEWQIGNVQLVEKKLRQGSGLGDGFSTLVVHAFWCDGS